MKMVNSYYIIRLIKSLFRQVYINNVSGYVSFKFKVYLFGFPKWNHFFLFVLINIKISLRNFVAQLENLNLIQTHSKGGE